MPSTTWKRIRSVREPDAKSSVWKMPETNEHLLSTKSPEDLFLNPEDFDEEPEDIQGGETSWAVQSFNDTNWYTFDQPTSEFYVRDVWEDEV